LDIETVAFLILFEDLEGLRVVKNLAGRAKVRLHGSVCVRHIDKRKDGISKVTE
jgi:hypothetical protein